MRVASLIVAVTLALPLAASGAGIPLLDAAGAPHGSVSVNLGRGLVRMKVLGLPPLPADVNTGAEVFQAHLYKAYLSSSTDPAAEVFLTDVWPSSKLKAVRRVMLAGDLTRMGFDRVTVTAFSKDGLKAFDVLTATLQ